MATFKFQTGQEEIKDTNQKVIEKTETITTAITIEQLQSEIDAHVKERDYHQEIIDKLEAQRDEIKTALNIV